jgi:hypothetical protein
VTARKKSTSVGVQLALGRVRARAERLLEERAASDIPPFAIPRIVTDRDHIAALRLDRRSGAVLARIDGETGVQALVDMSGISTAEVRSILARLVALGVVTVG